MKVLSVIWEYCSTAALVVDGEVVACVSEERFSRKKNDESYPRQAIEYVLKQGGVSPNDLDHIALAGERFDPKALLVRKYSSFSIQDRLREQKEFWYPRMYENRSVDYLEVFKDKLNIQQYPGEKEWSDVVAFLRAPHSEEESNAFYQDFRRRVISRHLNADPEKVVFPHHHKSHAYYAYYGSPIRKDRTLILTADAWGDDMNASVNLEEGGDIRRLSSSTNFIVARLYRSMTLLLGMKPDEHEYKIMGLAAYARPDYYQGPLKVFRETMCVDGLGFKYKVTPPDLYVYFRDKLEGYRFDAIAGALQQYTEEILVEWTRNCLKATGARRLCFGGGIAMNVKAMMEIAKLEELEEIFICAAPSDESLPMGAAYAVIHDGCKAKGKDPRAALPPLKNAYLGPDLEEREIQKAVDELRNDAHYSIRDTVDLSQVARTLSSGKVVGRCSGRSEFGARALGNRSILADPRRTDVVRTINEKVKCRDFWMPFAPSILQERTQDYLINPKNLSAPYMTLAFETTPLAQKELPAALHQADLTCRPQMVAKTANPGYHALISEFEKLTNVGSVLNTSFNIHGEPIIQTGHDAIDVLKRSGLDALLLGNYWIEKKDLPSKKSSPTKQKAAGATPAPVRTGSL